MLDFFLGHYAYLFLMALFVIGLYGVITKRNLVKKLIGLNIFQSAVILIYVASASKWNATVPILEQTGVSHGGGAEGGHEVAHDAALSVQSAVEAAHYINPLPHTLMLTAIVVGVATTGVALALLITIHRRYGTLDETELLERMG
jgi:multicomponent Na+:H+ antiporter subunit C